MEVEEQLPDPQLMESMRSVGYSLESALADLIDNSLTAGAKLIRVLYRSVDDAPIVGVLDDGGGMSGAEARVALQLAGTSRDQVRASADLGRFGLGLKTASLSQARVLTLITKHSSGITGLEWDLDFVARTRQWSLRVLDEQDIHALPLVEELTLLETGTLILWRELDLLLGDADNTSAYMAERMANAAEHLELVFHRFIAGEPGHPAVRILVNHRELRKIDPFLEKNPATQVSPIEQIGSGESRITVQAFTLPHLSKLSAEERVAGRIGERMRDTQGFYVYRGRRLIEWGSWFRLAPKDELAKLARVRVDIPNSLDGAWGLDIKKSRAVPPESVRRQLRRLIDRIVGQSRTVHTYRGRAEETQIRAQFIWELTHGRDSYSYRINRSHPLLTYSESAVGIDVSHLDSIYTLIEDTFPVHDLYARMSKDEQPVVRAFTDEFLLAAAQQMWAIMRLTPQMSFAHFVQHMSGIEPFADHPRIAEWLLSVEEEITIG